MNTFLESLGYPACVPEEDVVVDSRNGIVYTQEGAHKPGNEGWQDDVDTHHSFGTHAGPWHLAEASASLAPGAVGVDISGCSGAGWRQDACKACAVWDMVCLDAQAVADSCPRACRLSEGASARRQTSMQHRLCSCTTTAYTSGGWGRCTVRRTPQSSPRRRVTF